MSTTLEKRLAREKKRREKAEQLLEDKSRQLYAVTKNLERRLRETFKLIIGLIQLKSPENARRGRLQAKILGVMAKALGFDAQRRFRLQCAAYFFFVGVLVSGDEHQKLGQSSIRVLASVPELEEIATLIKLSHASDPGQGSVESNLLRIVRRYQWLVEEKKCTETALNSLKTDASVAKEYLPKLGAAIELLGEQVAPPTKVIPLYELKAGMTLAEDLCLQSGTKLLGKGYTLDMEIVERVHKKVWGEDPLPAKVAVFA